jgi:hypothetical protein
VVYSGIGGTGDFTVLGDQQSRTATTTAVALTAAGFVSVTPVAYDHPRRGYHEGRNDVVQGTLGGTLPATAGKRIWVRIKYRPAA